ncbi:MAG TPA: hypothetical protein VEU08_14795 [Vicinamibacterales bacterium]|nr:hypothetical protein [Vicinamibacterales bacterium]
MKIAVIGGAGVRTPLLVRGLTASDLPIDTIALFDTDAARLAPIAGLAARVSTGARVSACRRVDEAIEGADFVFTSIRAGGAAARASDEAVSLALDVVGQETVGPAGLAMAMRNVPPIVAYAEAVALRAPRAWIVNFTNPVGIVTEAILEGTGAHAIGICDTPTELFEDAAAALGLEAAECRFDYVGLNHLGWLREVLHRGEPQLHRIWNDPRALTAVYRRPFFEAAFLSKLRLLPTEYLYFYYRPADAVARVKRAGATRGRIVEELTARLFATLERGDVDIVSAYDAYLDARCGSYMQIETDGAAPRPSVAVHGDLAGYDRIALAVVRAIHFNQARVIPLNVRNGTAIGDLEPKDVVEVPCLVDANGARPVESTHAPPPARELLAAVKAYERLAVRASLERDRSLALRALAANPLVPSESIADALLDRLQWRA